MRRSSASERGRTAGLEGPSSRLSHTVSAKGWGSKEERMASANGMPSSNVLVRTGVAELTSVDSPRKSTLEAMLEKISKRPEARAVSPPKLPQRPLSVARLPSSVQARMATVDGSSPPRLGNHGSNSPHTPTHMATPSLGDGIGGITFDNEKVANASVSKQQSEHFSFSKMEQAADRENGASAGLPPLGSGGFVRKTGGDMGDEARASAKASLSSSRRSSAGSTGSIGGGTGTAGKVSPRMSLSGETTSIKKLSTAGTRSRTVSMNSSESSRASAGREGAPVGVLSEVTLSWKADTIEGLKKNSSVWVKNGLSGWMSGSLDAVGEGSGVEAGHVRVRITETGELKSFAEKLVLPANPELLEGVEDLTQLSYLNEPSILHNLSYRYAQDRIYTKAGPVLIAVNPFKRIPLYGQEHVALYRKGGEEHVEPHVYMAADSAYCAMVKDGINQSIIISGESGAGKTETAKIAMQYLAALGGGTGVEDEILQTNPILEAFGNAKTLRNDNSSRFGKLIDIHFDKSGKICGANIKTYLLEKSRVVQQAQGERSYHVFYQLCAGANSALRQRLQLREAEHFKYLNQSDCMCINGVDDAQQFQKMLAAMTVVQIRPEDQENALSMLSAVLWIGNIEFRMVGDQSEIVSGEAPKVAAGLLRCSEADLEKALCRRLIRAGGESIEQHLKIEQAQDSRDALAKAIYAGLFDWLVEQINKSLEVGKMRTGRSISILDIYGFESFKKNSFEQLCINYANERLQQHFNRHLFKLEQEEYTREKIDWTRVEFEDNQECLDLIEKKPMGLLSLLDEECIYPRGSDASFAEKCKSNIKDNARFQAERGSAFRVLHFAGEVMYDTAGFLDKNKDLLHADLLQMLANCDFALAQLFAANIADGGSSGANSRCASPSPGVQKRSESRHESQKQSVGTKFKGQLTALMQRLETTAPHFIRCIKPNTLQKPGVFDKELVLQQLRCCGVLEVVRISRLGYPTRYPLDQFAVRYGFLLRSDTNASAETEEGALDMSRAIITQFGIPSSMYQIGVSKLFFRAGQIGMVEDLRARTLRGIVGVQKTWRMHRIRLEYLDLRKKTIYLQSLLRRRIARKLFEEMKMRDAAAKEIQRHARRLAVQKKYQQAKRRIILLQAALRGFRERKKFAELLANARKAEEQARMEEEQRKDAETKRLAAVEAAKVERTRSQAAIALTKTKTQLAPVQMVVKQEERSKENKDVSRAGRKSYTDELLKRAEVAEAALKIKEEENAQLRVKLQETETRWEEYESHMHEMEHMWQQQMASLQLSVAAAKKTLTNNDDFVRPIGQPTPALPRGSRQIMPHDSDGPDSDEGADTGSRSAREPRLSNIDKDNGMAAVEHLKLELDHRTRIFDDDADFLVEVKSGQTQAELDPEYELKKLKDRFVLWKKDFKVRLRDTKLLLAKYDRAGADTIVSSPAIVKDGLDGSHRSGTPGKKSWWGSKK